MRRGRHYQCSEESTVENVRKDGTSRVSEMQQYRLLRELHFHFAQATLVGRFHYLQR